MTTFSFKKIYSCLAFILVVLTICAATGFATLQPVLAVGPCYVTGAPSGPCMDQVTGKASLVQHTITAGATSKLNIKETLDGLAWAVAKQMVSSLTQSMVEWINSGFQGSPAFVTDLGGFLKDALDTAAGEYIKSLGGVGEFICSPFKLDVQAALQISYQQAQSGMPSGPTSCKLSGIENNIQNFLNGGPTDIGQWMQITRNPENTPFGAYLKSAAKLDVKLKNEAGKELTLLDWGKGWKSLRACIGADGKKSFPPCKAGSRDIVTTPGDVIAQQINYQLHTGTEALVTADEINEIIGALISQVALQAMKGVNGLLGLGGNNAYTDYSYGNGSNTSSYINSAVTEETLINVGIIGNQVGSSTATEAAYLALTTNSIAIANNKVSIITDGQTALANILNSNTAATIGISTNSTYADAQAKINTATAAGRVPFTDLAVLQTELTTVYNSFATIVSVSPDLSQNAGLGQSTDLTTMQFVTLQSAGASAKASLTNFVTSTTALIPQIQTTLTALKQINKAVLQATNIASSTASSSTSVLLQKAVKDYLILVQSSAVISESDLDQKRKDWQGILGVTNLISSTQTITPSLTSGGLLNIFQERYIQRTT